jgi:hypothetical protein
MPGTLALVTLLGLLAAAEALAKPHPRRDLVPVDPPRPAEQVERPEIPLARAREEGIPVLRVQADWDEVADRFRIGALVRERSGTASFARRAARPDRLGSYRASVRDPRSGAALAHDSIGTGQEYRRLTRALTFRFPLPPGPVLFELLAENPETGRMERVLDQVVDPARAVEEAELPGVSVRLLKAADRAAGPPLLVNVYAEGYPESRRARFWRDAEKVVEALKAGSFPLLERLELRAVFAPSAASLGQARNLGQPVPERDSFLGLYFPYWRPFGRWYHVVYPTRESRFRHGSAQVPYDYALALVDSDGYWGVGNYRELTAIPAGEERFTYLLLHELGHFFGLNEEYDGGGPTELAFAPGIEEPWSQNITFLSEPAHASLKWSRFVEAGTPLPTPRGHWNPFAPRYGAYAGGYAETEPMNRSHIPGLRCVMDRYEAFCPVCKAAIEERLRFDLGELN